MSGRITESVVVNGRRFPRYLTSPSPRGGWLVRDLRDGCYVSGPFPSKRLALTAAKRLNRGQA